VLAITLIQYTAEFPVADIKDIEWSDAPFSCLSIPDGHRDTIMALAETHMGESESVIFDDFVAGKGRGLIVLLQYDSLSTLS